MRQSTEGGRGESGSVPPLSALHLSSARGLGTVRLSGHTKQRMSDGGTDVECSRCGVVSSIRHRRQNGPTLSLNGVAHRCILSGAVGNASESEHGSAPRMVDRKLAHPFV